MNDCDTLQLMKSINSEISLEPGIMIKLKSQKFRYRVYFLREANIRT